jgi:ATP-binding cassette subfamily B protein
VAEESPIDVLGHLPKELGEQIRSEAAPENVEVAARFDLDEHGRYAEGYLVLTEKRLGTYRRRDGAASGEWRRLGGVSSAVIVEGLGMGVLRLIANDALLAEYRFTLRYAKEVAKLHRQMERRMGGKGEAEAAGERPKPDEKKVRCEKCDRVIPPWSEVCPGCTSRRKVLSRLLDYVKPYRARAIIGFALAVLVTVAGLVRPILNKPILDDALDVSHAGKNASYHLLLIYIFVLAGLMLFGAIAGALKERVMAVLGASIARDLRDRAYEHLHKLSLSFFSKKPTGSLVTRVTSDTDRIWDFVAWNALEAIISFLTIVGIGVALFFLNWKLAVIVLLPVPIMFGLATIFHKRLHRGFERLFHRWSLLTALVADALPGVRVIKAFSQERNEVRRFTGRSGSYYDNEVEMIGIWTVYGPLMEFCTQVGSLLVWIVGGYWTVQGLLHPSPTAMSVGTLFAFMGYMWMFYGPIHGIAHMDRMLNRAAASVQRIFEILDTEPIIFSKDGALPAREVRGRIELRNVSFSYDGVRKVLKNINLTIPAGEMVGLAGPSGGGKTTMVNIICRFYDVLEGQILIDGADIRDYDVEQLRRCTGVVLQEPFLFYGTVARNIAYGNPDASLDDIIAAAKAANAHDFIVGFPDGYDTMVGERGHTLSAGERQRISIARAILHDPAILILDEATSSVDTEAEKLIQEALDRLTSRRTTIAIAHRLSTLRRASRLIILDKGEIVEQGSHDELSRKEGGLYARLLKTQVEMQSAFAIGG